MARKRAKQKRNAWPLVGLAAGVLFAAVAATQFLPADPRAILASGDVYQSGRPVGHASGAKFSSDDPSKVEFDEIADAEKLSLASTFEYGGFTLKVAQVRLVDYAQRPKLLKVVAKLQ